ncbi:MAG: MBL fold metallo-hydrolase [Desulfobacterales bacterium]|nr:MBL fold metallo-hydrolase [Desulfobacterales bacterium]
MDIEILGAESLGVRGLCCFVKTGDRKILIDPGIALGYIRNKLLPHPFQISVDESIQKKIIHAWSQATDIVISHFHGDHVPLADANPYQLDLKKCIGLNHSVKIWSKDPSHFSPIEHRRAESFSSILNTSLISAEGIKNGPMVFSQAVPHGDTANMETVMMTRIEANQIFVHASDIQLLDDYTVSQILFWKPNIILAAGPPLYLQRLSELQLNTAWKNAIRLGQAIDQVILDHHLMRSHEGVKWLKDLSHIVKNKVVCAADFMQKPKLLLEAERSRLYEIMPVPEGWHERYRQGNVNTDAYRNIVLRR